MPAKKKAPTKTVVPRPAGRKQRTTKHNYVQAQQWFVEGKPKDDDEPDGDRDWLNLREISEATNIPYARIRERAAHERWTELRAQYQKQAAASRREKRIRQLSEHSVEFDNQAHNLAKIGMQLVGARLGEIVKETNIRKIIREEAEERLRNGEAVDRKELWSAIRSAEMIELARAAETWQNIGRKALGTDVQQVHVDVQGAVETTISVANELERDDPDRLAAFLAAADRAGLWEQLEATGELGDIVDGEVVEDDQQDEEEVVDDAGAPAHRTD